jgi:hypothetical protein
MDPIAGSHHTNSDVEDEELALIKFTEETGTGSFDDQMKKALDRVKETQETHEQTNDDEEKKKEPAKRPRGRPPKQPKRKARRVSRDPSSDDSPAPGPSQSTIPSAFPPPKGPISTHVVNPEEESPPKIDDPKWSLPRSPIPDTDPPTDVPIEAEGFEYGVQPTALSGLSSTHGEVLGAEVHDHTRQLVSIHQWQKSIEGRLKTIETSMRSLETSMTRQATAVLDRFRTIERTFAHDPIMTSPAVRLADDKSDSEGIKRGTDPETEITPPPAKQRKLTFREAMRAAKEGKKGF